MPIEEGFGGFKWGTSIEEFLTHFPMAYVIENDPSPKGKTVVVGDVIYKFKDGRYFYYCKFPLSEGTEQTEKESFERWFKHFESFGLR